MTVTRGDVTFHGTFFGRPVLFVPLTLTIAFLAACSSHPVGRFVEAQDVDAAREFFELGGSDPTNPNTGPIARACSIGPLAMVELLHQHRERLKHRTWYPAHDWQASLTCMLNASSNGQVEVVRWGHEQAGYPIDHHFHSIGFSDGKHPIEAALDNERLGVVDYLLTADIGTQGALALHRAIANDRPDHVSFLLSRGVDPNSYAIVDGKRQDVPLVAAIRKGSIEIVKLLIANGANVKYEDSVIDDPLTVARRLRRSEIVPLLEPRLAKPTLTRRPSRSESGAPPWKSLLDTVGTVAGVALGLASAYYVAKEIAKTPSGPMSTVLLDRTPNHKATPDPDRAGKRRTFGPLWQCPDGTFVDEIPCHVCPDGSYIGAGGTCWLTPSGDYVRQRGLVPPRIITCADGSTVAGDWCQIAPDGTYVGVGQ